MRDLRTITAVAVVLGLVTLATLPAALRAGNPSTQPAGEKAAASKPMRIVFFGDSITGYRPGEPYQGQYLKFADLVGLMAEARRGVGTVTTINSGYAGDATYARPEHGMPGAVNRVESDVLKHKPDVVVMLIGGNDKVGTDEDRKRTAKHLDAMVKQITDAGVRLLVLQYPPATPADEHKEEGWYHIPAKNDLIAAAAKKYRAPTLDLSAAVNDALKTYPSTDLFNPVDGVHLHPRGEMVFARAIFTKLDELKWLDATKE